MFYVLSTKNYYFLKLINILILLILNLEERIEIMTTKKINELAINFLKLNIQTE